RPLRAGLGLELDLLTLVERAEAARVNVRLMDEQVLASLIGDDEAEPLVGVEPFHGSRSHLVPPRVLCRPRGGCCVNTYCAQPALLRRAAGSPACRRGA